jgi:uncharacterized damage-inducible protein DinB
MTLAESMLPEFDHEMKTTRSLLERVPGDKADWKPHVKSMTLGKLTNHLATLPQWVLFTLGRTELDFAAPDTPRAPEFVATAESLALFDGHVAKARAAIAAAKDEELRMKWTLRNGDQEIFSLPRFAVLRSMVFNHSIHHRGQLSVYLRLNDVPLPNIYGPTADTAV